MARIAIVNPPKLKGRTQRRRWKNKHRHVKGYYPNPKRKRRAKHKRRLSAKARRALLRNLKKARAVLNPKKRISRRKRRSHRRAKSHFINPFQSTLAVLGNPRAKRHKSKRRKHTMARRKHRRSHRRSLSNPFSANALLATPKEMVSTGFIMEAAGVAAGFVLPNMAMNYLPVTWRSSMVGYYASKVGTITVLSAAASLVSKRVAKFVLLGGGVSLILDVYTEVTKHISPAATTPPAPGATTTQAFYGNLNAYYGGMMNDWEV